MRAVRQQLATQLVDHGRGRTGLLRHRLVELLVEPGGLRVGEEGLVLDTLEVVRKPVDDLVPGCAKLVDVHGLLRDGASYVARAAPTAEKRTCNSNPGYGTRANDDTASPGSNGPGRPSSHAAWPSS